MKRLIIPIMALVLFAPLSARAKPAPTPTTIGVSGTTNDFGDVYMPGSAPQDVVLTRTAGNQKITIMTVGTITGTNASDFVLNTDGCTGKAPPPSCKINITFTPSAFGTRTATFTVDAPGASPSPFEVTLTGNGTGCGDAIVQGADGEICDFAALDSADCCGTDCQPLISPPVSCGAAGGCIISGTCDTNTGLCTGGTPQPDGTACDNGDACTTNDTCASSVCTSGSAVSCTPLDQCHLAGTCDSFTGCSDPVDDGASCDSGSGADSGTCDAAGVCQPDGSSTSSSTTSATSTATSSGGGGCSLLRQPTTGLAMGGWALLASLVTLAMVRQRRRHSN